jgi:hypothetical protein
MVCGWDPLAGIHLGTIGMQMPKGWAGWLGREKRKTKNGKIGCVGSLGKGVPVAGAVAQVLPK